MTGFQELIHIFDNQNSAARLSTVTKYFYNKII